MTLDELIERLTELRDETEGLGEATVLFAHQPHYPLQCGVGGPVVVCEQDDDIEEIEAVIEGGDLTPEEEREAREEADRLRAERSPIVYLYETSAGRRADGEELSPYGPSRVWDR